MILSSTTNSKYLRLLENSYVSYVWDWTHTWSSAQIVSKSLGTLADYGRFIPYRTITQLLTTTNTATLSATNIGIYTSTPSPNVTSEISATSVVVNSSTITAGRYVIHPVVTTTGMSSIAGNTQVGIKLSSASGLTTITARTWLFGFFV
jgi:hypothetical protein